MILWVSPFGSGLGLARKVVEERADIRLFVGARYFRDKGLGRGLVPLVSSLEDGLAAKPDAVIYDLSGHGIEADHLRTMIPVWGAGQVQDAIEENRGFGLEVMARGGIQVPDTVVFTQEPRRQVGPIRYVAGGLDHAIAWVKRDPGPWVLKPYDGGTSLTYVSDGPDDLIARLEEAKEKCEIGPATSFLLQRKVEGVEVSTEVWISNGEIIDGFANGTMEEKKFMPDGLGPATGAENAMMWVYRETPRIVAETMARLEFREWLKSPDLPDGRKMPPFHGPIDLNTIVTKKGPYGIEWTPRMGWNAYYGLLPLYDGHNGDLWRSLAAGRGVPGTWKAGFSYVMKATIPPYPASEMFDFGRHPQAHQELMEMAEGVEAKGALRPDTYLLDCRADLRGRIECAGTTGMVFEATGVGSTPDEAQRKGKEAFDAVTLADKQGNNDNRAVRDLAALRRLGYAV